MQNRILLFSFLIYSLNLISCSPKVYINAKNYEFKSIDGKPDYSDLNYWAAHPWKWDPSDSIPAPLKKGYIKDSIADVFFIHPTTLTDNKDERWNAPIDDSIINEKTDYSSILYQASVFNQACRVFSPRYRQAHIRVFFCDNKLKDSLALALAYSDVKASFEYYINNLNQGRPVIIASHSQGTIHAARLLKEFFEGKPLQNMLICAYIIGMPIPVNYFSEIPPCKDSLSTGCFVGWRTYKKDYIDTAYISKEKFKSSVTNPLTWTTTNEYASALLNIGGVLKNFNKLKKGVLDAQVHENILWTCKPKFFGNIFLRSKNYHIGDINLFYANIRENVQTRIKMYSKN